MKFLVIVLLASTVYAESLCPDFQGVSDFDVERFLGKWYEYKRSPSIIQLTGKCGTAEYSLNDDGSVKVNNTAYREIAFLFNGFGRDRNLPEGEVRRGCKGNKGCKGIFKGIVKEAVHELVRDHAKGVVKEVIKNVAQKAKEVAAVAAKEAANAAKEAVNAAKEAANVAKEAAKDFARYVYAPKSAIGKAIQLNESRAELSVAFYGEPSNEKPNYYVLDTDYDNYALIYNCDVRSGMFGLEKKSVSAWILSRSKELNNETVARLEDQLDSLGVRVSKLIGPNQDCDN